MPEAPSPAPELPLLGADLVVLSSSELPKAAVPKLAPSAPSRRHPTMNFYPSTAFCAKQFQHSSSEEGKKIPTEFR